MLLDARPSDDGSRLALLILVDEIVERFSVDRLIVFERCRVILDAETTAHHAHNRRVWNALDCYVILFHSQYMSDVSTAMMMALANPFL